MRQLMIRAAALIALVLALAAPATASAATATGTLHVVGNGSSFVRPDLATVMITVIRQQPTREAARGDADAVANRIVAGLVGIGVARPDIQTSNVSLSSNTIRHRHHRSRTVWAAEVDLTITTSQINLLSPLFATASRDGATSYAGPNFGFSNPSDGLPQATAAAISDAHSRAEAAATQMGLQIVGVQSVDISPSSSPLPAPQELSASSGSAGAPVPKTPVLPGLQEVDASVDIVYLVANAAPGT